MTILLVFGVMGNAGILYKVMPKQLNVMQEINSLAIKHNLNNASLKMTFVR